MKIIPLGTNGYFSSFGRQTACYAIPYKSILIVLDAGSGLFRFAEENGKKLLSGVREIHLFLSHYHLDHTFGFYAAFELFEKKKVTVYAKAGRQVFSEFVKMEHFPIDYEKKYSNFEWKAVGEGWENLKNYRFKVRKQNHRGEVSLGFRLEFENGKNMAYITDGEPTRESVEFVKGVDLLLHEHEPSDEKEAKHLKLEDQIFDGHVTTEGASLIAKEARVKKLALVHHNPFLNEASLIEELKKAKAIFKESHLAMDLEEIEF